MKRGAMIAGIVVLVLLAGAGGAYYWLSRPVEVRAFDEPGPGIETKQRNSDVQSALYAFGIESSLVDITQERAYVAYDAPAGAALPVETMQYAALSVLAGAAPDVKTGIVVLYEREMPALMWKADLGALRALGEDEAAREAFLASVQKTEF